MLNLRLQVDLQNYNRLEQINSNFQMRKRTFEIWVIIAGYNKLWYNVIDDNKIIN